MFMSPKRYVRTEKGEIVEAGPGVSGTLVVAEGAELDEREAVKLGLLDKVGQPTNQLSTPISRNPHQDKLDAQAQNQLRSDGPTLKEWTDAGYPADKYPPQGYAAREEGSAAGDTSQKPWETGKTAEQNQQQPAQQGQESTSLPPASETAGKIAENAPKGIGLGTGE